MKLTKRQLRKIIKEEKSKLMELDRGGFEDLESPMEAEVALSRAARVLAKMGYDFQDICDVVNDALSGPDM